MKLFLLILNNLMINKILNIILKICKLVKNYILKMLKININLYKKNFKIIKLLKIKYKKFKLINKFKMI